MQNGSSTKLVLHPIIEGSYVAVSGAIPKQPPPGLQSLPTSFTVQDTHQALSALFTGASTRSAGTAIMDTVLLGPALASRVSVPSSVPGYANWISSLRVAEGSGLDIMYNCVSACPLAEAYTVSAPSISVGNFPDSRWWPPAVTHSDTVHILMPHHYFPRASPW